MSASSARQVAAIVQRELHSYFGTPLAYVFIVIFLMLSGVLTFFLGQWYERGQADLGPFFGFHPWLYLFLVSAIAMRLWAEERRTGTLELLLTMPLGLAQAVLGKFLAAWIVVGVALLLTFPMWLTVNYLGEPDNGVILAGYLGSWILSGAFLAIGSCISAATSNQVLAFIGTVVIGFVFVIAGFTPVTEFLKDAVPAGVIDALAGLSFLTRFEAIAKGVLDVRDVLFFLFTIAGWLVAAAIVIDMKKGG